MARYIAEQELEDADTLWLVKSFMERHPEYELFRTDQGMLLMDLPKVSEVTEEEKEF